MEQPKRVTDLDGQDIGAYVRRVDTAKGEAVLVQRADGFGGGTIVFSARDLALQGGKWVVPYGDLSVLEAPPFSVNVELEAYLDFWEKLGSTNALGSASEFMSTGSGPVASDQEVPDAQLEELVQESLRQAAREGVDHYLARVTVNKGTVLLAGYQFDSPSRLAAAQAAASVPGVKEIVNMLVIRAA
jgi:hypothetical protein